MVKVGIAVAHDELLSFVDRYKVKFDWRKQLTRTIHGDHQASIIETKTFTRFSKRQQPGMRLMGRIEERVGAVAVILDTSGSIDDKIRSMFASVLRQLQKLTSFYLITNDAEIHAADDVYAWRDVVQMIRGGGGTNFCPAFEHLEQLKRRFSGIYVLTDGFAYVPIKRPRAPVYWLIQGDGNQPADWGKTIRIGR